MDGKRINPYQMAGKQNHRINKKKFYINEASNKKMPHSPGDKWIKGVWLPL